MTQTISVEGDHVLVTLSGSMYVDEAVQLRESLIGYFQEKPKTFIIDLAEVEYIDSSGLGTLVAIQKRVLQNGGKVIIKGLKGIVKELFELTRLNFVFDIQCAEQRVQPIVGAKPTR